MPIKLRHGVLKLKGQDMIVHSVVDDSVRCVLQRDPERYFEYEFSTGVLYAIDHVTKDSVKAHEATDDDFFVDPQLQIGQEKQKEKVYTAYGEEEVNDSAPTTELDTYGLMETLYRHRWLDPVGAMDLSKERKASQVIKAAADPNVDVKHLVQELNKLDLDVNWEQVFLTRYHTGGWELGVTIETTLATADYSAVETSSGCETTRK